LNSRYIRTQRTRLPRHQQSKRLPGSFEDKNRWIKCWNCGFVIDKDRLTKSDQMAFSITDYPVENTEVRMSGDELNIFLTQDGLDTVGTMIENGPDGNPITDYYTPRICRPLNGCPFCNVVNLP
jgi:hypothetical protein